MAEVIEGDTPTLNGLDTTDPNIAKITAALDLSKYPAAKNSGDDLSHPRAVQMIYNVPNAQSVETPKDWQSMMRQAEYLESREEYAKAEVLLKNALLLAKESQPIAYKKIVQTLNQLSLIYAKKANFAEAYLVSKKALRVAKNHLGSEDILYAASLATQANIYTQSGQYEKALKYYEDTLHIYRYKFDINNSSKVAYIYLNIADIYKKQKKYKEAIEMVDKSIDLIIELFGKKSPKLLKAYISQAELYSDISKNNIAMINYKKSIDLLKSLKSEKPREMYALYKSLTDFYIKTKNYKKAKIIAQKYLHTSEKLYSKSHPKSLAIGKKLASIEKYIQKTTTEKETIEKKDREKSIVKKESNIPEMNMTITTQESRMTKTPNGEKQTIKLENVTKKVEELERNLRFVVDGKIPPLS